MNTYMKDRWKKRRRRAIKHLGEKCAICGNLESLEFDHIDPITKTYTIARASSLSEKIFWEEVNKCQLLCKPCHNAKTKTEIPLGGDRINATFKDSDVIRLRKLFKYGFTTTKLIKNKYKSNKTTVYQMLSGDTYKHLPNFCSKKLLKQHRKKSHRLSSKLKSIHKIRRGYQENKTIKYLSNKYGLSVNRIKHYIKV